MARISELRKLSLLVALSFMFWTTGLPLALITANAAQVSSFSDTLSSSAPGVGANHTIEFTTPTGVSADGSTIVVTMPAGFGMGSLTENDVDIADDTVDLTTDTTCGAVNAAVTFSGQDIEIEICTGGGGAIAADSVVEIEVGTNASASGTGANQITNHATDDSYVVTLGGTMADTGETRIAIVETVDVSAQVNTIFSFSINSVGSGVTINDDSTVTTGVSTATTIPFGTLQPGVPKMMAQELRVDTNALNGFSVTIQADQTLTAGNLATIDEFSNGTALASSTLWSEEPLLATLGNTDTYGHWGITSDDDEVSSTTANLWGIGEAAYVGNFINNPVEVFYYDGPVLNTSGVGVGSTTVGFKIETTALQEAATDYTANVMYIATPVF